jgi:hypothetical protein
MIVELTTLLLSFQFFIDFLAILGGYFEIPFKIYWLSDSEGFLPFFRDDISIFNRQVELQRDMILIYVFFCVTWSWVALSSIIYIRKRRFLATNWPLTWFKFGTWALVMRLFKISWALYKFHFVMIRDVLGEIEEYGDVFEDDKSGITWKILMELYDNGTIGFIPAILTGSLLLNLLTLIFSMKIISDTVEWRRLNVSKLFY